jgi:hypothetical protein
MVAVVVRGKTILKPSLLIVWLCLLGAATSVFAADELPCQIHIILFTPADVAPPTAYQTRVDDLVACAESFFAREFKRWGHENLVMPFRRSPDGHVEVTAMRGKKKATDYKPVDIRTEVMDANRSQGKITDQRQVWWILVYSGSPPRTDAFLGGYGEKIGGWAIGDLDLRGGRIDPQAELGSDHAVELKLKGMIHELGHGLKLPHIGPLRADNAGNTLMGPTHINFRKVVPKREERVYLSEAEAAILSLNPVFRGVPDPARPLPAVKVQNLQAQVEPQQRVIAVTGQLVSNQRAVYAVVADESDARPGEYWTKTYIGKVTAQGEFKVVVTEPAESNGTLKTWFIFENGDDTGDGKKRSRDSGIETGYKFQRQTWTFQ